MLVTIIGNTEVTWPTTSAAVLFVIMSSVHELSSLSSRLHFESAVLLLSSLLPASVRTVNPVNSFVGYCTSWNIRWLVTIVPCFYYTPSLWSTGLLHQLKFQRYLVLCISIEHSTCSPSLHLRYGKCQSGVTPLSLGYLLSLEILMKIFTEPIHLLSLFKQVLAILKFDIKFNIHYFCFEIGF